MTLIERPDETPERFAPPISDAAAPFWEATKDRELVIQHCDDCDRAIHFPREACPQCLGTNVSFRPSTGGGTIYARTVMPTPALPFMKGRAPYVVALIDLDDGVRMLSNVVGDNALDAMVGDRVRVAWEALDDGRHLPVFVTESHP